MTVIAWDGNTLAGDRRTNFGSLHAPTTKVHRVGGLLVGCSGSAALIEEMLEWIRTGRDPEKLPPKQRDDKECASVLVIEPDGQILQYEGSAFPIRIESRQWAIGSGRDFAICAMHLGKSAHDAVQITSFLTVCCGNGVDALTLEPAQGTPHA